MNDAKKQFPDPLVRQRIFPEPAEVFDFAPVTLATALKDGLVVIDTNVLLIPYTTGKASLEQNSQHVPAPDKRGTITDSSPSRSRVC